MNRFLSVAYPTCTLAYSFTWALTSNSTLKVHGPVEMIAYQGGPCTKMFTLDQGCMCKWANRYFEDEPKLVGWEYVEKGARFGSDSLLLHLDPFKLRHQTAYNCVWFRSFQTLTFCECH